MKRLLVISLLAVATAKVASAQTTIVPDTAAGVDLGTTVGAAGNIYTIDGGTLKNANLFHSFNEFNVGTGDVAKWVYSSGDPASIANVINRVTGGTPSNILGKLDSMSIPNADFYFINPAGIIFSGQGAQVNVPAAAHFSTASELRFANGDVFSISTPSGSTLSVASPQSFGFLGSEGLIQLANLGNRPFFGPLFLPNNGSLSLTASDIQIQNSLLQANGVTMAAAGPAPADIPIGFSAQPLAGDVTITNSQIDSRLTTGGTGAPFRIDAGHVQLNGSYLTTSTGVSGQAGSIDIRAHSFAMSSGQIFSYAYEPDVPIFGRSGDISIEVDQFTSIGGWLFTETYGSADGGDITIHVNGPLVLDAARILANSHGSDGGTVNVSAESAQLTGYSLLGSASYEFGNGGAVNVDIAGQLNLQGSFILADNYGQGNGGDISVSADAITLDISRINSNAWDTGRGGNVYISVAGQLDIGRFSEISSNAGDQILGDGIGGTGGNVTISASDIVVRGDGDGVNGGTIQTTAGGESAGGFIRLDSNSLTMSEQAIISATSYGAGTAGNILINADTGQLTGGSAITSEASTSGTGGSITINIGGDLELFDSRISSSAGDMDFPSGNTGRAGDITINAATLLLDESQVQVDAFEDGDGGTIDVLIDGDIVMLNSLISSDARGDGNGGDITVTAGGRLSISGLGISSRAGVGLLSTRGPGQGGDVKVSAAELVMYAGTIQSNASGQADGGTVLVDIAGPMSLAESSRISSVSLGSGRAGQIDIFADSASLSDFALINSDAFKSGEGGSIRLQIAGELNLDWSAISSDSSAEFSGSGTGAAGNIFVSADSLVMNASEIRSSANADGDGGAITIQADSAHLTYSSIESNSMGAGHAGDITINSSLLDLALNSLVQSTAFGAGRGGSVNVLSDTMTVIQNSSVSADSLGPGDAGQVIINVGSLNLDEGGYIASRSTGIGNGGDVEINASNVKMSGISWILSNAFGDGNAGDISLITDSLVMDSSSIQSVSEGLGSAGTISIIAKPVQMTQSSILTNALGQGNGGDISLTASNLELDRSAIQSVSWIGQGHGGSISVNADTISMTTFSDINTSSVGDGPAGSISLSAGNLTLLDQSSISSDGFGNGPGGFVGIYLDGQLSISGGSYITTLSNNLNPAGEIFIFADRLFASGEGTRIGSENFSLDPGSAGTITIAAAAARIENGASISTNSENGPAGNINIWMPSDSWLILSGDPLPGRITTSSGPGTGGVITIASPLAIISNGGVISALGESGGANVRIDTQYFIGSADRPNIIEVDGTLTFTNAIYDVSAGTTDADLSVMDASGVLRGQCGAMREGGQVSQLNIAPAGPFGGAIWSDILPSSANAGAAGGCQ